MGSAARRRESAQHRADNAAHAPQGHKPASACIRLAESQPACSAAHACASHTSTWTSSSQTAGFCLIRRCHYPAAATTGLQRAVCFSESVLFLDSTLESRTCRYPTPVRSISLSVGILDYSSGTAQLFTLHRASLPSRPISAHRLPAHRRRVSDGAARVAERPRCASCQRQLRGLCC